MRLAIGCEALDGLNLSALSVDGEDGAAVLDFVVYNHRAGTAIATIADAFGARVIEFVAECVEKCFTRLDIDFHRFAVHIKGDRDWGRPHRVYTGLGLDFIRGGENANGTSPRSRLYP